MQIPYYIFFANGKFVLVIENESTHEFQLFHPFDRENQIVLQGNFSVALHQQLSAPLNSVSPELKLIEKQYVWLEGLSSGSKKPKDNTQMVIGDELGLLFLEITDQCNEKCIHCYASSSPTCSDFLSLLEIKTILLEARTLGRPFVQFTGGDPLIHRHLVEAVAYAHELDFLGLEIYTNGLLLNDALLEKLKPYQPNLAFSVYSPDREVHDAITQVKGSFEKTVSAIHRSQEKGLKIRIGMAVMEQNAGHEQAMLDFVRGEFGLPASSVRFDPVHETGRGENLNTKGIALMPSQNSHMPSESHEKRSQAQHLVSQANEQGEVASIEVPPKVNRKGKLAVCANGNISPCIFNRKHVLGNIREISLLKSLGKTPCSGNEKPSVGRWNFCQHNLSCADCQMVAYTIGDS